MNAFVDQPARTAPWRLPIRWPSDHVEDAAEQAQPDHTQLDRADFVRRVIAARCPELSDEDLALIGGTILSREVGQLIASVLDDLDTRIGELEQRLEEREERHG
jgi:hypothetical protein